MSNQKFKISDEAIAKYPSLDPFSSILITPDPKLYPKIEIPCLIAMAETLKTCYDKLSDIVLKEDNGEELYEVLEETYGGDQCMLITQLAHFAGLTEGHTY